MGRAVMGVVGLSHLNTMWSIVQMRGKTARPTQPPDYGNPATLDGLVPRWMGWFIGGWTARSLPAWWMTASLITALSVTIWGLVANAPSGAAQRGSHDSF